MIINTLNIVKFLERIFKIVEDSFYIIYTNKSGDVNFVFFKILRVSK